MKPKFSGSSEFHQQLKARVEAHLAQPGSQARARAALHRKAVGLILWAVGSYSFLVWGPGGGMWTLCGAISLALSLAGIGFNIQHDANHGAFSTSARVNRLMGFSLDLLGGSSELFRLKHVLQHHSYANVAGQDGDIHVAPVLRVAPSQPRFGFHRFQFIYAWGLYSLVALKWQWMDDVIDLLSGKVADQAVPRLRPKQVLRLLMGKALFLFWAVVIPSVFHPLSQVLAVFLLVAAIMGWVLAFVFQLAHCNDSVEFPQPDSQGFFAHDWATHQLLTTANFCPKNKVLGAYVGGLNFQVEHHLFPNVAHAHYPEIAKLVEATCREYRVRYRVQETLRDSVRSHVRWLKAMGSRQKPNKVMGLGDFSPPS